VGLLSGNDRDNEGLIYAIERDFAKVPIAALPLQCSTTPRVASIQYCSRDTVTGNIMRSFQPCGCRLWPSAKVLTAYMTKNPQVVRNKLILELGSGSGLCGIMAWQLQAKRVVLTDGNIHALKLLRHNAALNQLRLASQNETSSAPNMKNNTGLHVHNLGWNSKVDIKLLLAAHPEAADIGGFQTIIASDCLYEPSGVNALWKTVSQLLARQKDSQFIFSNERRFPKLSESFTDEASVFGFEGILVHPDFLDLSLFDGWPATALPGSGRWENIPLYVFRRKSELGPIRVATHSSLN